MWTAFIAWQTARIASHVVAAGQSERQSNVHVLGGLFLLLFVVLPVMAPVLVARGAGRRTAGWLVALVAVGMFILTGPLGWYLFLAAVGATWLVWEEHRLYNELKM